MNAPRMSPHRNAALGEWKPALRRGSPALRRRVPALCGWIAAALALTAQTPGKPGKLTIESAPKGAAIYVNGSRMGQPTDATFVVSAGTYKVSVTGGAGNLNCAVKSVSVTAGATTEVYCSSAGWGAKPK